MRKNLILEINRINELIGIGSNYNIISESNIVAKLLGKGADLLEKNVKKLPGAIDEFIVNGITVSKYSYNKLVQFLKGRINLTSLSNREAYILGKIFSMDQKLSDEIYNDVIQKFLTDNPGSTEKELLEMIEQEVRKGEDLDKVLKSIFVDPTNPKQPELKAGLLENKIAQKINNIESVFSLNKFYEKIRPVSDLELKKLASLNILFFSSYNKFLDSFKREFNIGIENSIANITDDTIKLVKEFKEGNPANVATVMNRLNDNIELLTKRNSQWIQSFEKWLSDLNVDGEFKKKIQGLTGYEKALSLFAKDSKEFEELFGTFFERRLRLLKQINSVFNPASWFGKPMEKYEKSWLKKYKEIFSGKGFKELREDFLHGTTLSRKGYQKLAKTYGWPRAAGEFVGEVAWNYMAMSALLALADYISDVAFGWIDFKTKLPLIDKFTESQKKSFGEHLGPKIEKEDISSTWTTVKDLWSYFTDELSDLSAFVPGGLDDVATLMSKIKNTDRMSQADSEQLKKEVPKNVESLRKKANDMKKKTENKPHDDINTPW